MNTFTNEQLNAFVDGQLDKETLTHILSALQADKELSERINQLRYTKDMLRMAYSDLPQPVQHISSQKSGPSWLSTGIAASILFVMSVSAGWLGHTQFSGQDNVPSFALLSQFNPDKDTNEHILLHISSKDENRIKSVLDTTEKLLQERKDNKRPIELEVVANSEGIAMLREGSPYQKRIQSIMMEHQNVAFYACGHAMENARLKEGQEVQLIPEANKVGAALEQIIKRLKLGWAYIRA